MLLLTLSHRIFIVFLISFLPLTTVATNASDIGEHRDEEYWRKYYMAIYDKPPEITSTESLVLLKNRGIDLRDEYAIDLGCGAGQDTLKILEAGFHVTAVDNQQIALDMLRERVMESNGTLTSLTLLNKSFESFTLENPPFLTTKALYINATYSMHCCPPEIFNHFWECITHNLKPNGVFSGQFFGINHAWTHKRYMTFFDRERLENLFNDFTIRHFTEEEIDREDAGKNLIHWHVFHVIAEKK